MDRYESLAREFFEALEGMPLAPPGERVGEAMRGEAAVMRLIMREKRSLTPGDICRALNMSSSRMAAVLGSLAKKGFVLRETDPDDKRRVLATITPRGEAFCREHQRRAVEAFSALLAQLGEPDAVEFVRLLGRVVQLTRGKRCERGKEGD